jgi:hypothetical protein
MLKENAVRPADCLPSRTIGCRTTAEPPCRRKSRMRRDAGIDVRRVRNRAPEFTREPLTVANRSPAYKREDPAHVYTISD